MRITHVISEGNVMGGAQANTFYSLRYQRACHDVSLVAGNDGPLLDACRAEGIPVTIITLNNRLADPLGDARYLAGLVGHLRQTKPHLVHTHSSKAGILGRLAARIAGVPVVVHTIHGWEWHSGQPAPVRAGIKVVQVLLGPMTGLFLAVADVLGDEFVRNGICSREKIRTVVSGIDFS